MVEAADIDGAAEGRLSSSSLSLQSDVSSDSNRRSSVRRCPGRVCVEDSCVLNASAVGKGAMLSRSRSATNNDTAIFVGQGTASSQAVRGRALQLSQPSMVLISYLLQHGHKLNCRSILPIICTHRHRRRRRQQLLSPLALALLRTWTIFCCFLFPRTIRDSTQTWPPISRKAPLLCLHLSNLTSNPMRGMAETLDCCAVSFVICGGLSLHYTIA